MYELLSGESVPHDAVLVSIWRQHGRSFADVACMHCAAEKLVAADFPMPVSVALQRAKEVALGCGVSRVVIALAGRQVWNPAWGDVLADLKVEVRPMDPDAASDLHILQVQH